MLLFSCFLGFQLVNRYFQFVTQELNCSFSLSLFFCIFSLSLFYKWKMVGKLQNKANYAAIATSHAWCQQHRLVPVIIELPLVWSSRPVPSQLCQPSKPLLLFIFFLWYISTTTLHSEERDLCWTAMSKMSCCFWLRLRLLCLALHRHFDSNRGQKFPEQTRLFGQCDQNHLTFCQGDRRSLISARNGLFDRSFHLHHWCVLIIIC